MQRERRHDEVERAISEWQRLLVSGNCRCVIASRGDIGCDNAAYLAAGIERAAHGVARRAEIDGDIKLPKDGRKPFGNVLGDAVEQERRWAQPLRAPATPAQQGAIEDDGPMRHASSSDAG